MSKIVYLLGAGASYGSRNKKDGKDIKGSIIRGVPIVNEFSAAIENLNFEHIEPLSSTPLSDYKIIYDDLEWLADKCAQYPTIDTYAKMLFITEGINGQNYNRLKRSLSLFLTLMQEKGKRDLRYDGFIASLIQEGAVFPKDISILSWNYDSQFEYAFSDYMRDSDINYIWDKLNVYYKYNQNPMLDVKRDGFGIMKLNGTALLCDNARRGRIVDIDNYSKAYTNKRTAIQQLYNIGNNRMDTTLSFAWEEDGHLKERIKERVQDTEVLVVIGYSFPYVNRGVDRVIVNNMPNLSKVYIQDPNASSIRQNFEAVMGYEQTIRFKKNNLGETKELHYTEQFIIPSELA